METPVKKMLPTIFLVFLCIVSIQGEEKNTVIVGPGYQKGQTSSKQVEFSLPTGWINNKNEAQKIGIVAVLLPNGKTLENTKQVITIAFQKKDSTKQGLGDLKSFVKVDLQNMYSQFPDTQFVRWQPSSLNPAELQFMSFELFGKVKDQPSPQRILYIDSGDGFFSIGLTVETVEELHQPLYENFFNSIKLK